MYVLMCIPRFFVFSCLFIYFKIRLTEILLETEYIWEEINSIVNASLYH